MIIYPRFLVKIRIIRNHIKEGGQRRITHPTITIYLRLPKDLLSTTISHLFFIAEVLPPDPIVEYKHDEIHDRAECQGSYVSCYTRLFEGKVASTRLLRT